MKIRGAYASKNWVNGHTPKLNLLITCLTLASDDIDFEYCKYNIKNGMAPLHSYRNGELTPFL